MSITIGTYRTRRPVSVTEHVTPYHDARWGEPSDYDWGAIPEGKELKLIVHDLTDEPGGRVLVNFDNRAAVDAYYDWYQENVIDRYRDAGPFASLCYPFHIPEPPSDEMEFMAYGSTGEFASDWELVAEEALA